MDTNTLGSLDEMGLREFEAPWPKTQKELLKVVSPLVNRKHDYGTAVHAVSIASTTMFQYMANKVGLSGFQAGCADMDILRRTRGYKYGFKILDYGDLLYPQLIHKHVANKLQLLDKNMDWLVPAAKKLLKNDKACTEVKEHWRMLSNLNRKKEFIRWIRI